MRLRVYIGFDPSQADAYAVAASSLRRRTRGDVEILPLRLDELRVAQIYKRAQIRKDGQLFDTLTGQPFTSEFTFSRYLVPALAGWKGWALSCDCDFLFRADVEELFALADDSKAMMCVPHRHVPDGALKMEGLVQETYDRKNWSSLMLWNCAHPAHAQQVYRANNWQKHYLHQLAWLTVAQIGFLPEAWNWLEGVSPPAIEAKAVHFTRGLPRMAGYENAAFADEWREELRHASRKT